MALSSSLSHSVPERVRSRGWAYFAQGRATVVSRQSDILEVEVRGSRPHLVVLTQDVGAVVGECDCPDFTSNHEPCKHIWAALLAAERQKWTPSPVSLESRRTLRSASPSDRRAPRAKPSRAQPPANPEDVLRILDLEREKALQGGHQWTRNEGIAYVVDLAATLASQHLIVGLYRRRLRRDGSWGKLSLWHVSGRQIAELPDAADRRALSLLGGSAPRPGSWVYAPQGEYALLPNPARVAGDASPVVLEHLCATGRCFVRHDGPEDHPSPLVWEGGPPWEFRLSFRRDTGRRGYTVEGVLGRGGEQKPLDSPGLFLAAGVLFEGGRVFTLEHGGTFSLITHLRRAGSIFIPEGESLHFVAELLGRPRHPRLDLPEELRFEEIRTEPRPCLRILKPVRQQDPNLLRAELQFEYGGVRLGEAGHDGEVGNFEEAPSHGEPGNDGEVGGEAACVDVERRRLLVRDESAERKALVVLRGLGFRRLAYHRTWEDDAWCLRRGKLAAVVPPLLSAGWCVEAEGKLYRSATAIQIEVVSGIDWFELRGGAVYEGAVVPLPALLAALRKREGMVVLDDGTLGLLPEEWLERYAPVAALGTPDGEVIRFTRAQTSLLDALLAATPDARWDETFEQARGALKRFDGIAACDPPRSFKGTLRPYQREGLGWFRFLREFGFGGCLADDMGLGKTVQVLALLEARRMERRRERRPSLVVAPRSLVLNWKSEAGRFTPKLTVLDHTGTDRASDDGAFRDHDLVLTTYGTLRRDASLLSRSEFDYVILDESQAVKNAVTQSAKAVRLLRGRHRLALSGTPIENHLGELWSLFEFLNPGMLGASPAFRLGAEAAKGPDGEARALLARALRPFILRRTKEKVAPELPARTEQTRYCELEAGQRRLYDELREHYRRSLLDRVRTVGLGKSKIQVLEALLRLRQAACHPALIDPDLAREPSAKLDILMPQLKEVIEEGHKALVFSQFTSFLAIVRMHLGDEKIPYAYLDGSTPASRRAAEVNRFQTDSDCKLFLISLKAGGLGLNLTAADYVYLLDPWWNPAVEAQAIDRAHRIGQTRPVIAYRIVAADTVEEKILTLQASKRELADAILSAESGILRELTRDDLELLLS